MARFRSNIGVEQAVLKRLSSGAFWSLLGSVIARGAALASSVAIARLIGKAGFGELAIIQNTVSVFALFSSYALSITATKYVAEFKSTEPQRAGTVVGALVLLSTIIGIASAIGLIVSADTLANDALSATHLVQHLRVAAVYLVLSGVAGIYTGALAGLEAFKASAKLNIWSAAASVFLMAGGALVMGLEGAVWGMTIGAAGTLVLSGACYAYEARKHGIPTRFSGIRREWSMVRGFTIPTVLGGILGAPVTWYCNTLLSRAEGGYAELGVFNAATQWRTAILFLPTTLGAVALPVLGNLYGSGAIRQHSTLVRLNGAFSLGVASLAALPIIAFSSTIVTAYGKSFAGTGSVLALNAVTACIVATGNALWQGAMSKGQVWSVLSANMVWTGAMVLPWTLWVEHRSALSLSVVMLVAALLQTSLIGALVGRSTRPNGEARSATVGHEH